MKCSEFQQLSTQRAQLADDAQLREQWERHLLDCTSCAEAFVGAQQFASTDTERFTQSIMTQTISLRDELDGKLSELRERQAPPELLAGVLRQTIGVHAMKPVRAKHTSRHWAFIQHIMLRPRIALEASFALTCCWALIFGVPTELAISTASADEQLQEPLATSRRKIAEFQQDMAVLFRAAQPESRQGENQ